MSGGAKSTTTWDLTALLNAAGFSSSPHFMYSGHYSSGERKGEWFQLYSIGFGGMAYADVGLSFWLLSPIPDCSSLDLSASAEVLFEAALQGSTFSLIACGSTSVGASICGVSDSFGLTVKGSVNSQGNITLDRIDGSCGQ